MFLCLKEKKVVQYFCGAWLPRCIRERRQGAVLRACHLHVLHYDTTNTFRG